MLWTIRILRSSEYVALNRSVWSLSRKQRQKLHDRLRQSLRKRNAMAEMVNGSQYPQNLQQPPQSLQLVNVSGHT